jgi:hypothetical protein
VALARWRIEAGADIPTHENGEPRSKEAIMLDVNRAFEAAVRRDPANWFWVHNRWKASFKSQVQNPKPKTQGPERQVSGLKSQDGGPRPQVHNVGAARVKDGG